MKKYKSDSAYDVVVEEVVHDAGSKDLEGLKKEKGAVSQLIQDNATGAFFFYNNNIPASPKSLNEAKGYVIADYQDFLESKWVKQLNADYNFDLDEKVFNGLIKK